MTAHIHRIDNRRRDQTPVSLRRRLAAGLLSGLALLGGCASLGTTASGDAINAAYRCDNGRTVGARYMPPNAAEVTIDGHAIDMHIAQSASGARYVGGGKVWWTKGSGPGSSGTLFTAEPGTGFAGERITSCVQTGK